MGSRDGDEEWGVGMARRDGRRDESGVGMGRRDEME